MKQILMFLAFVGVAFSEKELSTRVALGATEDVLKSRYQVQINIHDKQIAYCGGVIVSRWNVLSAAHCFTEKISYIEVLVGSSLFNQGDKINVSSHKPHPQYNDDTMDNDVIVLTLKKPLKYSGLIKSIRLAEKLPPLGSMVKVAGWGEYYQNSGASEHLRWAEIPMVDIKRCIKKYGNITRSMFCAGYNRGKSDCVGDSGGPVVWKNQLVGIISFGDNDDCTSGPSGYASIPALRGWIDRNVRFDRN